MTHHRRKKEMKYGDGSGVGENWLIQLNLILTIHSQCECICNRNCICFIFIHQSNSAYNTCEQAVFCWCANNSTVCEFSGAAIRKQVKKKKQTKEINIKQKWSCTRLSITTTKINQKTIEFWVCTRSEFVISF